MKQKSTGNKAEKYDQEAYLKQQNHKDNEHKKRVSALYNERPLPKTRRQSPKGK